MLPFIPCVGKNHSSVVSSSRTQKKEVPTAVKETASKIRQRSLSHLLLQRECGMQHARLERTFQQCVLQKVINDKCFSRKIPLNSSIQLMERCGDYLVVHTKEDLSLYDVSLNKKIWNYPTRKCDACSISPEGVVLFADAHFIYVIHEGKKVGEIEYPMGLSLDTLRISQNRILGISVVRTSTLSSTTFYIWDKKGFLIKSINMGDFFELDKDFAGRSGIMTNINNYYYVAIDRVFTKSLFVYNWNEDKEYWFGLEADQTEIINPGFYFKDNKLLYSVTPTENKPSRLYLLNIETKMIEKEFDVPGNDGIIKHHLANERFIVFGMLGPFPLKYNIYAIDLNTNNSNLVKQMNCGYVEFTSHLNLAFISNHLIISYKTNDGFLRCVINLEKETMQPVQEVKYENKEIDVGFKTTQSIMSFEKNIFLIPKSTIKESAIFLEDFTHLEECEISNDSSVATTLNSLRIFPTVIPQTPQNTHRNFVRKTCLIL